VAVTDAFGQTQYVCDGRTGAQGPQGAQGAPGSTAIIAQTWINQSNFAVPVFSPNTGFINTQFGAATLPGTSFSGTTAGGRLLIQYTIPLSANGSTPPNVWCQPNVDDSWAGAAAMGNTWYDGVFQFAASVSTTAVTVSRVYQGPAAGPHTFTLACASSSRGVTLQPNSVISYSVFELR
jgi:hypothetical protein